jgi:serine/threonine protein kinase
LIEGESRIGTQIAGCRIESMLGRGGMGVVYLGEDLSLGRKVAIKVIAPDLARDVVFRERFVREARLAASLDHPHIIPVYEAREEGGDLYLAMRYVDGSDLRALLLREGVLDPTRALEVVAQAGSALDAAHEAGLVHRDVKPANILIAAGAQPLSDHIYLSDFGLTKEIGSTSGVTGTGAMIGTLDYMAPEQIRGEVIDGRADTYALGCVLYQMLTGRAPYSGNEVAVMLGHLQEPPPKPTDARPDLPAGVDTVVRRALAKNPGERYETCAALAAALETELRSRAGRTQQRTPGRRRMHHPSARGSPTSLWLAGVALALGLAVLSGWVVLSSRSTSAHGGYQIRHVRRTPSMTPPGASVVARRNATLNSLFAVHMGSSAAPEWVAHLTGKSDFAQEYVDIYAQHGGGWKRIFDATTYTDQGMSAPVLPLGGGSLAYEQVTSVDRVHFEGAGDNLVIVTHRGVDEGVLTLWVLGMRGGQITTDYHREVPGGKVSVEDAYQLTLTIPVYKKNDALCCPSAIKTQTIGRRHGSIRVLSESVQLQSGTG